MIDHDSLRMPPNSVEAEQALIGGLLLDSNAFDRIADVVREGDFYRDEHRRIFRHIKRLIESGRPADVVIIFESLDKTGDAQHVGGLAYLGELANNTPSVANIRSYADSVRKNAILRGLIAAGDQLQSACVAPDGKTPEEIAGETEAAMAALLDRSNSDPVRLVDAMGEALVDVEIRRERGTAIAGLSTGFADFDQRTGGLEPGQLVIVAARPSVGKTVFAGNVADHVARYGTPVLFFTMEMGRKEIAQRILAARTGVSVHAMRQGTNDADAWKRMSHAVGESSACPLFIDDRPAVSVSYIRAKARRIQRTHGLGLIVIDYLGLMRADGKHQNRVQEIGSISRGLKACANR